MAGPGNHAALCQLYRHTTLTRGIRDSRRRLERRGHPTRRHTPGPTDPRRPWPRPDPYTTRSGWAWTARGGAVTSHTILIVHSTGIQSIPPPHHHHHSVATKWYKKSPEFSRSFLSHELHYYYYTRLTALFAGLLGWTVIHRYQKGKINLDFTEAVSGSGIRKFARRYREITTPAPHHSIFLQAGCPSCRPTNSVKALKAQRWPQRGRKKFPEFSRLFQTHKLTFPQVIATKSKCNNDLFQGSLHSNSSNITVPSILADIYWARSLP